MTTPKPVIIVDTREQRPLPITECRCIRHGLQEGDYGLVNFSSLTGDMASSCKQFAVERKAKDLPQSLCQGRERFMREVERLKKYYFCRILIEYTKEEIQCGAYQSNATPQSLLGTLDAIESRAGIPIVWGENASNCARLVEHWAKEFMQEKMDDLARAWMAMTEADRIERLLVAAKGKGK